MKDNRSDVDVTQQEVNPSEEHQIRVEKVHRMRQEGIEPWPVNVPVGGTCKDVLDEFKDDVESREYDVAGRLVAMREHGKTAFAHIQDRTAKLQLYIRKDIIGDEAFEFLKKYVDIGDFVQCSGISFKTKVGEITLKISSIALISKCLYPLPEKFHGLADVEIKYRQRYLDLISNKASRERFLKRSSIIRVIRQFFDDHGYVEAETPMLHPIPGGAAARPFVTHHNALDIELYMRIAPELYLKRLVIGGFDRVYEINRNFRNEGISTRHNPEFTMLEFYTAYQDYNFAMDFTETLLRKIALEVCGGMQLPYGDHMLDYEKPFVRLSMRDAVMQYGKCSESDVVDNIDALLVTHKIKVENKQASWGEKLFALFEELVEPYLVQPTFITGFPVEVSPLAKRNKDNPNVVDRFELFVSGMELSNAFNELNDPIDQAERFKQQVQAHEGGDAEAHRFDSDYVHALEYGLPPTVGVGIGIDRLTMLMTNATSIKDVILFPTLKKK